MKYEISEEIASSLGLEFPELLAVLLVKTGVDIPKLFDNLEKREVLVKDMFNGYYVTQRWDDVSSNILLTSEKTMPKDDVLTPLAEKLMEIFPPGKKPGTNNYWKGNKREIILKLKKFCKLYGQYTEDEIIAATQAYVDYHRNDTSIMRTLKYFILKQDIVQGEVSDLATWLENRKADKQEEQDWMSTLR